VRMEVLVEELLDSARVEQRQVDLDQSDFDVVSSIEGLLLTLPPEWASRVTFRRSRPIVIRGDQDRLERVLLNLLTNAFKYSPPEAPVRITLRSESGWLLVAVRDRGVGISSQDVPHVFERFYRTGNSPHGGGLGLGLYIAREIVERHGGKLTVRSVEGKGSTFAFTLPIVGPKPDPAGGKLEVQANKRRLAGITQEAWA
jgi:signal transduction histidine kinase